MALLPWFRALHVAATLLIGGAFAFELLILRRSGAARDGAVAPVVRGWLSRQCGWGIAVGIVSWAGWLAAIAVNMSGLPASQAIAPEVIDTVIARTTFGHVWWIRLALFIVLGALVARGITTRAAAWIAFTAALALVASLAWTGHALGTNRLHVWVDAVHLLAATAWLGMLPLLWLVIGQGVSRPGPWRDLGIAGAQHFFLPGLVAVVLLAASGLANTSWMVDSASDLAGTAYGRILSMKLALFALMLMLAIANRLVFVPRVERAAESDGPLRSLRRSVLAELVLGAGILAIVAWLGVTPPASHEHMRHLMGEHRMENM